MFELFLDCIYQIGNQFPTFFEFNAEFLRDIAFHSLAMQFGTFLGNCDQERETLNTKNKTTSLWTYINNNKKAYKNPFYQFQEGLVKTKQIYPYAFVAKIKLWEELHMKWILPSVLNTRENLSVFNSTQYTFLVNKEM